jgi:Leucine-rich repeat (LRR) protein
MPWLLTQSLSFSSFFWQSLDLSANRIERVPLSFRSMLCLERLILTENQITELLGDELMASLRCLDVSHNCLTQLSNFTESLGRRCFQLEELNLSWNELDASTTKLLDEVVVPKWTVQIKWLRNVQWTPQKEVFSMENEVLSSSVLV